MNTDDKSWPSVTENELIPIYSIFTMPILQGTRMNNWKQSLFLFSCFLTDLVYITLEDQCFFLFQISSYVIALKVGISSHLMFNQNTSEEKSINRIQSNGCHFGEGRRTTIVSTALWETVDQNMNLNLTKLISPTYNEIWRDKVGNE